MRFDPCGAFNGVVERRQEALLELVAIERAAAADDDAVDELDRPNLAGFAFSPVFVGLHPASLARTQSAVIVPGRNPRCGNTAARAGGSADVAWRAGAQHGGDVSRRR